MRVLLSTYGSHGDVEPMVGLAARLRALGAEVRMCAPPDKDFAELLARVGALLVPVGQPVRLLVTVATTPSAADVSRHAAAEGCDALVATGVIPAGVLL